MKNLEDMAPTKIKCFTLLVVKKACLTHEVLQKKGGIVVTKCFCAMGLGNKQSPFSTLQVHYSDLESVLQPHKDKSGSCLYTQLT